MKIKYYLTILIVLFSFEEIHSQTTNQNYILTRTYTNDAGTAYLDQIQYFDGLGRPVQTVQRGITPDKADLISLQEYDGFGRESNTWLPAVIPGNNGAYVLPATIRAKAVSSNANDQKPYAMPVYEASPLNRVLKQFGPGADWQDKGKAVSTDYLTNGADAIDNGALSCRKYTVTGAGTATKLIYSGSMYSPGELYVTRITDEDGNRVYELKDKLGQLLLTRSINNLNGTIQHLNTLYVYDDFGNLCYVIPPLGFDKITDYSDNSEAMKQYAYLYKYDGFNRCIWKKLPGCEPIFYVYDKADRLIFSQDGEQRAKKTGAKSEWIFNKYDTFGRLIISGIYKTSESQNQLAVKYQNTVFKEEKTSNGGYGYTWDILKQTDLEDLNSDVLIVNYYDDINHLFSLALHTNYKQILAYTSMSGYGVQHTNAKGQLVATRIKNIDSAGKSANTRNGEIATAMYYDTRGRLIQAKSTNHIGGVDEEYIAYNFTGQPTQRKHIHSATGKNTQTEVYTYSYDHAGRLLATKHQLTDATAVKPQVALAENTYDELGRLKTSKKGGIASSQTTYVYNIRSWTKSISSTLFSQTLYYNDTYGGNTLRYNGNITAMAWKQNNETSTRGYAFSYDNLSRLTAANYLLNGSTAPNKDYKIEKIAYDKHGNINVLQRYGKKDAGTKPESYGLVDNLSLDYAGNQLIHVADAVPNFAYAESADFKDKPNAKGTIEYTYNANGAMNKDLNKGISDIQYNSLNLPRQIVINSATAKAKNYYTYSASGVKLKTEQRYDPNLTLLPIGTSTPATDGFTNYKNTDYVGNIIYETTKTGSSVINKTRILVDGGYIENNIYYYYLTDHLGNNRVVVKAGGTVTQRNHYYPFGTAFAEKYDDGTKQKYKYNGKELDDMHQLNLYDYSARFYESAVGRFMTVDPLAEKYYSISPYAYVMNNPLRYIDPDGCSTHTDSLGHVVAVYNDGNTGVFKHGISADTYDGNKLLAKNGTNMGETDYWDEFLPGFSPNGEGFTIQFGESFDGVIEQMHEKASNMDLKEIAANSAGGGLFDIKKDYPGIGRTLNGKYVSSRSAGNYLAGYNASGGTYFGKGISFETFQKLAGALHIEESAGRKLSTLQKLDIVIMGTYSRADMNKFKAPTWGEIPYQYRMSKKGWNHGK